MSGDGMRDSRTARGVWIGESLGVIGVVALATAIGLALRSRVNPIDVAMLYLLAVVFLASRYRRPLALLACGLSVALFDFLFVPPYYTFEVLDQSYLLTFGVMLIVALSMTGLTALIRDQAAEATRREQLSSALYTMIRELAEVSGRPARMESAARHIGAAAGGRAVLVLVDDLPPAERPPNWPGTAVFEPIANRVAATWVYEHAQPAGRGTRQCADADALAVPLRTATRTLGVAMVTPEPGERIFDEEECRRAAALAGQAAVVIEHGEQ